MFDKPRGRPGEGHFSKKKKKVGFQLSAIFEWAQIRSDSVMTHTERET